MSQRDCRQIFNLFRVHIVRSALENEQGLTNVFLYRHLRLKHCSEVRQARNDTGEL